MIKALVPWVRPRSIIAAAAMIGDPIVAKHGPVPRGQYAFLRWEKGSRPRAAQRSQRPFSPKVIVLRGLCGS
jgi:hypothetical protein